jgi:hypothetical protein
MQFSDWKISFFKKLEKLLTHSTTGTQHCNDERSAGEWRGGNQKMKLEQKTWF